MLRLRCLYNNSALFWPQLDNFGVEPSYGLNYHRHMKQPTKITDTSPVVTLMAMPNGGGSDIALKKNVTEIMAFSTSWSLPFGLGSGIHILIIYHLMP